MDRAERQQKLYAHLKAQPRGMEITMAQLAKLFAASERTIANDLDAIETRLQAEKLRLVRKARHGVWMESLENPEDIHTKFIPPPIMMPKERRDHIILALLRGRQTIDALAEDLQISRSTLLLDLKEAQTTLEKRDLHYQSKRGLGIWVEGEEQALRDMWIHIFARKIRDFRAESFRLAMQNEKTKDAFLSYAKNLPLLEIAQNFLTLMNQEHIFASDAALNRMICALTVAVCRLQEGHNLQAQIPTSFITSEGKEIIALARMIASTMVTYAPQMQAEGEITYIVRELLHSRIYVKSSQEAKNAQEYTGIGGRAITLARRLIAYAELWLGDSYLTDAELVYNLAVHLRPALERQHFHITLSNPLLPALQEKHSSLFTAMERATSHLAQETGLSFSADEVGYLAMHLGAAVERKRAKHQKRLAALLVCGNGVGTASLLKETLRRRLPYLAIAKTQSLYRLEEKDFADIDLVISTVPIERKDVAVLHVSPILTEEELCAIEGQITYLFGRRKLTQEKQGTVHAQSLQELLTLEAISLDVQANDWEEAVRLSGEILERMGKATANYTERMVASVHALGAYMVVCPGVAMPHATPEDGALALGVSFLRLQTPVTFPTLSKEIPEGKEVRETKADLFFAFTTTGEKEHIPMMEDLWEIFSSAETLAAIRSAPTKEAVQKVMFDFLHSLPKNA